jgi:polysaccharide biosynthesis PFTS motif protein
LKLRFNLIRKILSLFTDPIKKRQRGKLRLVMRAHRALKRSGHVDRIAKVKQALTEHSLNLDSSSFSPTIMGQGIEASEIIVRQYLLVRVGGLELNRALLLALGKKKGSVIFYLPKEWRDILEQHGFEVAHFRSSVLWKLYICAAWLYGVLQIVKITFAGMTLRQDTNRKSKRHVYFVDLGLDNLPHEANGSQSHDVVSWYLQWSGRAVGIEEVRHTVSKAHPIFVGGVELVPAKKVLLELAGGRAVSKYVLWGLRASIIAAFDCLRGRWGHALLLNQAALAAQFRAQSTDFLAQEYLFHISGLIYRPLWTYEAERCGSAITLYFYSTNCESFKRSDGYPQLGYGWKAMNWPNYLVWDEYQADFVRRAVGPEANVSIVGPIWFQSSAAAMHSYHSAGVAIFDVTPFRQSRYSVLGLDHDYYIPETSEGFLSHISDATCHLDVVILWKRKRKIGAMAHPRYRYFSERLSEQEHVVLVDPDISAFRVIESSCAVISMPFTSTALIAESMGIPTAYYDPSGLIQRGDRAAHGIEILIGKSELEIWISTIISKSKIPG